MDVGIKGPKKKSLSAVKPGVCWKGEQHLRAREEGRVQSGGVFLVGVWGFLGFCFFWLVVWLVFFFFFFGLFV